MFWPLNRLPRFDGRPAPTDLRFHGQTVLLTAASGGVGLAAAKSLAERGVAILVVTARTEGKATATKNAIEAHIETALPGLHPARRPTILALVLEMDDAQSILHFVANLMTHVCYLDHAILNAAVLANTHSVNPSTGYEESIHVNAIAPIFLSVQLLPLLLGSRLTEETDPALRPHLVIISSGSCWRVDVNGELDNLYSTTTPLAWLSESSNFASKFTEQYSRSKLMMEHAMRRLAFLSELEKDTEPNGPPEPLIIVGSATPGPTASDLLRRCERDSLFYALFLRLLGWIRRRPEVGANCYMSSIGLGLEGRGEQLELDEIATGERVKNVKSEENIKLGDAVWEELLSVLKQMDKAGDGLIAQYLEE
jgi:NAD(P)-dependent dehydrogenase (short-subunit alcohol dehydrogenase family)